MEMWKWVNGSRDIESGSLPASEWFPDVDDFIARTNEILRMHACCRTRLQTHGNMLAFVKQNMVTV